jgi:TonB family protein
VRFSLCLLLPLLLTPAAALTQEPDSTGSASPAAQGQAIRVYAHEGGLISPTILPRTNPIEPGEKCNKKLEGKVSLDLIVDATGHAQNATFVHPTGTVLDDLALVVAHSDRFQPGTLQGASVATQRTLELQLKACVQLPKDKADTNAKIKLRQWPTQRLTDPVELRSEARFASIFDPKMTSLAKIGGGVIAPKAIFQPEAVYSDKARRDKIQGTCVVTLVIDPHGMPQDIHMARRLDPGLDQNAIEAVSRYRFKPAYREGEPVPTKVSVEVRFALY